VDDTIEPTAKIQDFGMGPELIKKPKKSDLHEVLGLAGGAHDLVSIAEQRDAHGGVKFYDRVLERLTATPVVSTLKAEYLREIESRAAVHVRFAKLNNGLRLNKATS
jgi:hypothetical protein